MGGTHNLVSGEIWTSRQWLLGAPGSRGIYPTWLTGVQEVEVFGWCVGDHGWWGSGRGPDKETGTLAPVQPQSQGYSIQPPGDEATVS